MSRELATLARPNDDHLAQLAAIAGVFHDFGKYSDSFQKMLSTGQGHPQHAIHGAMLAKYGTMDAPLKPGLQTVAAAIAGHHAGLADWTTRFKEKMLDPKYRDQACSLVETACADSSKFNRMVSALSKQQDAFPGATRAQYDLFVRMLFSCLIDADRLDSAGRSALQDALCAKERLQVLLNRIAELQDNSPEGKVKQMRSQVLADCLHASSSPQNLFSLSVPTGGGKTLASMAFALQRAALYPERFRRVIVVIPFLSIIEQNAQVYAGIFGHDALLEHHSGCIQKLKTHSCTDSEADYFFPADDEEEEMKYQETGVRLETENWDAPLVVTTSVRFFESIFSNRPSDLRRVHNIARSIVILDEVQTLPRRLLGPLLDIMKEMSEDWDTNFVFATATQPAFERQRHKKDLRWKPGTLTEIIRDPVSLRKALKRVDICWEIDTPVGWPDLAQRMLVVPQCLVIVNVRDHASQLYEELLCIAKERNLNAESVFHLSTRMCAAHRLRVLDRIRLRLKAGQPCHVVSTQLVEAGVDVDFPQVLRALAPLDSIVQAAGRADREGKLTAALNGKPGGKVVVFLPIEHKLPPHEYKQAAGITCAIAKQELLDGKSVQVDSAHAIGDYFERYYGGCSDRELGKELLDLRRNLDFATLAQEFEMISNRTRDVFVPDDEEAQDAIEELRLAGELRPSLRRTLQRHIVGLIPSEFEKAKGVLERVATIAGDEIWVATAYDEQLGLNFNPEPIKYIL